MTATPMKVEKALEELSDVVLRRQILMLLASDIDGGDATQRILVDKFGLTDDEAASVKRQAVVRELCFVGVEFTELRDRVEELSRDLKVVGAMSGALIGGLLGQTSESVPTGDDTLDDLCVMVRAHGREIRCAVGLPDLFESTDSGPEDGES